MPTGMEGPKMTRREELRADVKAGRERAEKARGLATDDWDALMAKVAKLRERTSTLEPGVPVQTQQEPSLEITSKMRAEAEARAKADRKRLPDN